MNIKDLRIVKDIAAIILLVAAGTVWAQNAPIPLVIETQAAPVVLQGTLTLPADPSESVRYSYHTHLSATNESGKSILLLIVSIDIEGQGILTDIRDYFFARALFEPNAKEEFDRFATPFPTSNVVNQGNPEIPKATARVVFVQFADGSSWGDRNDNAQNTLRDRWLSWQKLRSLKQTYDTLGKDAFVGELTKPTLLVDVGGLQSFYDNKEDNLEATINRLTKMLHNADLHAKEMRESGDGQTETRK